MADYPIKVLQINAENFGSGGISVIIWRLMEELKNSNVHMSYLSQRADVVDSKYLKEIHAQGGEVLYINPSANVVLRYFDRYKKCRLIFKNNDYDIVHINGNESFGIISYVLAAKKCHNCKIVVHAHSTRFMKKEHILIKKILKFFFQNMLIRNADCLLACSMEAARFMYGNEADKAIIVKNGLRPQSYSYDQLARVRVRNENEAESKMIIGHIGRFVYAKNHEFIIKVFEHVQKIHANSELWLIGEKQGSGYETIYNLVKEKGLLSRVRFLGNTDQIREYLSAMDVLLFPSRFEGLPLVLVEAQVNGLPIVCSNVITDEAVFAKDVIKLSLDAPLRNWADSLIQSGSKERRIVSQQEIAEGGFDISSVAGVVLGEYEKMIK